jgi:hypothetical protein
LQQPALSLQSFGERAASWAATLGHDVSALVADDETIPAAFVRAVEMRVAGRPFLAIPLLDDLRTAFVRSRALDVLRSGDLDAQRAALERLALQSRAPEFIAATPQLQRHPGRLRALYDFVLAADGVAVRSIADYARLRDLVPGAGLQRVSIVTGAAALRLDPVGDRFDRDLVLVWAPHLTAPLLGLETFALAVCGHRAAIVCRGGRLDGTPIDFATVERAAPLLARAKVVIIADPHDPAPAVAFAAAGYAVVAAATSGAIEQLRGVVEYDPASIVSLSDAIGAAWNAPATVCRADAPPPPDARRFVVPEDGRCVAARQLAATAWAIEPSYDLRRDAFDRIANGCGRLASLGAVDGETVARPLGESGVLQLNSWHEAARARAQLGLKSQHITVEPERDHTVPAALDARSARDAVVVWAPTATAEDLVVFAMALHYEKRRVFVVAAGGAFAGSAATVVSRDAAAAVLARAAVCIDANTRTPGSARALARLGIPLAVASTSGADALLDNVAVYDPWDHGSIFAAAAIAKTAPPPLAERRIPASELEERLAVYAGDIAEDGPLVSVVILTRNRRTFLRAAVASVARQRYRNIETIVVRNGGVRVDDIVAQLPGGRVLDSEENLGVNGGWSHGTLAARGRYIAYLADDDEYLPEHIGRAVTALERTGGTFAHGGMLAVHLVPDGAGGYGANGYGVACERPAEPGFMRAMNSVATPAMLMDREALIASGNWDDALGPMADYEVVMRFMLRDELVYVNRPVVIQTYRRDASQYSAQTNPDMPNILRRVYERHPVTGQPWAERTRAEWIANFARHQATQSSTPLWYPQPTVTFPTRPYSAADDPAESGSVAAIR